MTKRLNKGQAYRYVESKYDFAFIVLAFTWRKKGKTRQYAYTVQILWDRSKDGYLWDKNEVIDSLVFDEGCKIYKLKADEWVLDAL